MADEILSQFEQKRRAKNARTKQYSHTVSGLISKIYSSQRYASIKRNHPLPNYSKKELQIWMLSQPCFNNLYNEWVKSDFQSSRRPSCDRIDDYMSYTLENIRLTTWEENNARGCQDRLLGINRKLSKPVLQFTVEGILVEEYCSARNAWRETGIGFRCISSCCRLLQKTAGGFVWCFSK